MLVPQRLLSPPWSSTATTSTDRVARQPGPGRPRRRSRPVQRTASRTRRGTTGPRSSRGGTARPTVWHAPVRG